RIEIRGFGSFTVREYGAYNGRNPRTGNDVPVKPKRLPFFKVGKELKKMVDKKTS
ncbi:MAG TPA: HU family DNA-binding protein, partial [Caldisericia bacterium]|nr:HU family DNA-binding protein [Caldisericia bacterium]